MGCKWVGAWRLRRLSKSIISRVITGVAPLRALIPRTVSYLLSPLGLEVGLSWVSEFPGLGFARNPKPQIHKPTP